MNDGNLGKIIVVDDEIELKKVLVEALTTQGYDVAGYASGPEALEALHETPFDVILTDLMMPQMDGISLLRASLEIDPHVICIVMTGHGTIQTAVDAMKVGAFDYVLKPFRMTTILPVLTRAMNTRRLRLENLQLRETVAIYELCQTIAFTLDQQTIISKLADAALQQTFADEVSILLPTSSGEELYVAAVRGENRQRLLGERVPLEESISGWVARQRQPLILAGEVSDTRFRPLWPHPEIRSSISVPMQIANKLVGTININALNRRRPFTLGQMKALTILSSTAAAALESASLYSQVRDAEESYRSIFENAVEGIFQTTPEGQFSTVNPSLARILGYESPEEVIAEVTNIAECVYVNPEDRVKSEEIEARNGVLRGFEFEARRKNDEKIWLSLNRRTIRDEQGVELFREGSVEDITERKRAEEALKSSEAELRALFASMSDIIIVFNDQGRQLKIAPTETPHLYKPVAERIGKTIHETFPKDRADFFLDQIREALAKNCTRRVEYSLTINGNEFWYDGSVSPMTENTVIWVARDITERKLAEEDRKRLAAEIEKQRERLDNIVSTVPGVVWEAWGEPDAAIQQLNFISDYVETMLGYSVEEWLSTPNFWLQIVHPDDRERAAKEATEAFTNSKSRNAIEFRWIKKDGTTLWVESTSTVVTDADGRPIGQRGVTTDISERKRAGEALRESEARYRDMVENARDIIYAHDLSGKYTSMNRAGGEITGYTTEEALAMSMLDTVAPEYIPKAREMTQRKLAGENVTAYEMEILAKDGHRIPVEVNTWLMHQDSVPVGVTGIARDITQRKEAEAQLRFQKSLLESQNEASIDGILVVAPDGKVLSYNRRFCELWGLSEEQLAAKNDGSALESVINLVAAPEKFLHRVKHLYEHPDETSQEEIELKDGRVFDRHSAPVRGPAGEYYGRVWYFHDITDRKRAQAELTRLAAAVQQTADSILITDPAGNIEYVNPAFERITGYSNEEALGHNPRILKSGKNNPAVYADLWQTIKRGGVWEGQLVNKKKDGTMFSERATISAVRDKSGQVTHYVAVKKDMTHEIQLEDQLRQSQKMEAIGQLAGGVAHDFNNLLTAINGYSSLALQRIDVDSPIKSYLEEIKKAGDRAANLTRQLLAFGRKQILQPVPLNLNDIVTDMNKMLRRLIGEDIELNAKLDPKLKTIKADPGQIEQVLVNLVVNARDAMPSGGDLTIETTAVELDSDYAGKRVGVVPGRYVMLAVSDTGTGMSEEVRARIFDPFFTTKDKGKGTGLGLSTVYGIVKQSGGNIWVYSEEGRGTTFKVYLPQFETAEKMESLKPESEIPHGSETILLLEDEDMVRNLTRQILESAGYKVVEAARGEEAIKRFKAENGSIDLLLTDVVMPEMSGKEVADRICELRPSAKVLFMSGYTDEAIVHHGVLDSNVQFIQKPFTPAALAIKIREVLEGD